MRIIVTILNTFSVIALSSVTTSAETPDKGKNRSYRDRDSPIDARMNTRHPNTGLQTRISIEVRKHGCAPPWPPIRARLPLTLPFVRTHQASKSNQDMIALVDLTEILAGIALASQRRARTHSICAILPLAMQGIMATFLKVGNGAQWRSENSLLGGRFDDKCSFNDKCSRGGTRAVCPESLPQRCRRG